MLKHLLRKRVFKSMSKAREGPEANCWSNHSKRNSPLLRGNLPWLRLMEWALLSFSRGKKYVEAEPGIF